MKEKDKLAREEEQQFFVGGNVRYVKIESCSEKAHPQNGVKYCIKL